MTGIRSTGFIVSLGLLAFTVCSVAVHRRIERSLHSHRATDQLTVNLSPIDMSSHLQQEFLDRNDLAVLRAIGGPLPFGDIVPALQIQEAESPEPTLRTPNPPTSVPAPVDAIPIEMSQDNNSDSAEGNDQENSAVRDVIERELAHAPREERDIWFDELKTLPAGVVRDLLQVRKQLRALPRLLGGLPEKLASTEISPPVRAREISAEPASQKIRFSPSDDFSTTAAVEAAVSQLRHNLTNAATPGFKRLRVTLVDHYSSSGSATEGSDATGTGSAVRAIVQGEGCRMAVPQLDLKQGLLKKTGRQLDVCVDGEGFFVVRRGDQELLTRCGAFMLDRDRQLFLSTTDDRVVLQPDLSIPAEAQEVCISADGTVSFLKPGETSSTTIGKIMLARVASPARLQPVGQTMLATTRESGSAVAGSPMTENFGVLQQGYLEQSNVDFQSELDEIEDLMMILKALPIPYSHPATASGPQGNLPRR